MLEKLLEKLIDKHIEEGKGIINIQNIPFIIRYEDNLIWIPALYQDEDGILRSYEYLDFIAMVLEELKRRDIPVPDSAIIPADDVVYIDLNIARRMQK